MKTPREKKEERIEAAMAAFAWLPLVGIVVLLIVSVWGPCR